MINIILGFENLPGLSAKDFVTLAIIQHYIDFKVSIVKENITTVSVFAKRQAYPKTQQKNNTSKAVSYVTNHREWLTAI